MNIHPHGEHICICPICQKEIIVAAGVKCNTQICPGCGSLMIAKEAGERYGQVGVGISETETRAIFALVGMLAFAGIAVWFFHKYGEKVIR